MAELTTFNAKKWMLFNFIGWFLGVFVMLGVSSLFEALSIRNTQIPVGVGMGFGIGLLQWWLLRTSVSLKFNWVWVSVFGMSLPFVVLEYLSPLSGEQVLLPAVCIGAIITGYVHYAILKPLLNKAILWLPASAFGWLSALAAVKLLDYTHLMSDSNLVLFFVNLGLILSGGVLLGASTSLALRKMLKV
ncbi:MAG: hypothetical protein ACKOXF_02945 [Chitinophagaceae bacterium]